MSARRGVDTPAGTAVARFDRNGHVLDERFDEG